MINCSIKPNPLDLTRKGKFWGLKIRVRLPVNSIIPALSYEWESLNLVGVLNLDCTDVGVWWHGERVTLTGKLPKSIQIDVSVWTAITQFQRNTIKGSLFSISHTCSYLNYAVFEGEVLSETFQFNVIYLFACGVPGDLFTEKNWRGKAFWDLLGIGCSNCGCQELGDKYKKYNCHY